MRRRAGSRFAWLIVLVLQLALPGATAWADARLERESLTPRGASHVESHRTPQCPRAHPLDCALCQHLASPLARAAPAPALFVDAPRVRVSPAGRVRPAQAPSVALPQSRAPPLS